MSYLIVFFGVMLLDILYIIYTKAVVSKKIHKAATASSLITISAALIVVEYNSNPYTILIGGLGGFIGTYLGDYIERKFLKKIP